MLPTSVDPSICSHSQPVRRESIIERPDSSFDPYKLLLKGLWLLHKYLVSSFDIILTLRSNASVGNGVCAASSLELWCVGETIGHLVKTSKVVKDDVLSVS